MLIGRGSITTSNTLSKPFWRFSQRRKPFLGYSVETASCWRIWQNGLSRKYKAPKLDAFTVAKRHFPFSLSFLWVSKCTQDREAKDRISDGHGEHSFRNVFAFDRFVHTRSRRKTSIVSRDVHDSGCGKESNMGAEMDGKVTGSHVSNDSMN